MLKNLRAKKVWTDAFDNVNKIIEDLEVLNEFHDAGDVGEEELDNEFRKAAAAVEELEFKKMLSREEDQLSAVIEINPGGVVPKARIGPICLTGCTSCGGRKTVTKFLKLIIRQVMWRELNRQLWRSMDHLLTAN